MGEIRKFKTLCKDVVFYGYDFTDVVIFVSQMLTQAGKDVIVCDMTNDNDVYTCFKTNLLDFETFNYNGVKYMSGFSNTEPADVRIICAGFDSMWKLQGCKNYLVAGYASNKLQNCRMLAQRISEFDLIVKGSELSSGPKISILSKMDSVSGIGCQNTYNINATKGDVESGMKVQFYGQTDYYSLSTDYKQLLKDIGIECGVDLVTLTRMMK